MYLKECCPTCGFKINQQQGKVRIFCMCLLITFNWIYIVHSYFIYFTYLYFINTYLYMSEHNYINYWCQIFKENVLIHNGVKLLQISCRECNRKFHKLAFCVEEAAEEDVPFTCKQCLLGFREICSVSFKFLAHLSWNLYILINLQFLKLRISSFF